MQKARGHSTRLLPPLVGTRFQVLFHSPSGVLFTFPSRYLSAIGHLGVLSLGGWSPQLRTAFHGSGPTQERATEDHALSPTGLLPTVAQVFHKLRLTHGFVTSARVCTPWKTRPTTPGRQRVHAYTCPVWADPLSLATTQGVSVDFLSSGYLDVSVPPLASAGPMYSGRGNAALPALGFPIRESADQWMFSSSPRLIAAVHALHRLLVPRHPPCALTILTVIRPDARRRPALVIPVSNLANICGFQGPVRSAAAGDSGGRSLKTQQRAARRRLSREEQARATRPGRHARRPAGIESRRPAP